MPDDIVKVTVNLTRQAFDALERAADREGLSRTDAINQALLAYEQLSAAGVTRRAKARWLRWLSR